MRHNIRDAKGRFVSKENKCKCDTSSKTCSKNTCACNCEYPESVRNFVHAAILTALDITMSPCTDVDKIARTEIDYDKLPAALAEDLKEIGVKTIYDFGQYIVVGRSLINDAIEQMALQLTQIIRD